MRSSGRTWLGLDGSVVERTKSRIACFARPSFQDGSRPSDVTVCAEAETGRSSPDIADSSTGAVASRPRRLIPEEGGLGFMLNPFETRHSYSISDLDELIVHIRSERDS